MAEVSIQTSGGRNIVPGKLFFEAVPMFFVLQWTAKYFRIFCNKKKRKYFLLLLVVKLALVIPGRECDVSNK